MEFTGKTVLVTGAATGIGRAATELFIQQGATVGVNHFNQKDAFGELKNGLSASPGNCIELEADVRDSYAITGMVEKLINETGCIDVLVNNAGISIIKPFLDMSEEDWDSVIGTNLKSVFLCCRAVIPHMTEPDSVIINVSSELAYTGRARFAAYTASKGGILSLTRSLAREFAPAIRVNAVAPGPAQTPLLQKEMETPGHEESLDDIPLGRYAEPEEIAQTIVFLASNRARYYCGDVLSPNGGTLMR